MADSRNIVIELKVNNSQAVGADSNNKSEDELSSASLLKTALHPIKSLEKATVGQNILVYQAYNYAKQQIKQVAQYTIGKYFSLTENYTAQQDLENVKTTISKVAGFGSAIISGAMMGSMAGPGGAAAGAIIATVGSGINEAISIYQRFKEQDRSLINMNVQSNFQLTRMGLVDGGRDSMN